MAPMYDPDPTARAEGPISWGDLPIDFDSTTVLEILRLLDGGDLQVERTCRNDAARRVTRRRASWREF